MRKLIVALLACLLTVVATASVNLTPAFQHTPDGLPSVCLAGAASGFGTDTTSPVTFTHPALTVVAAFAKSKPTLKQPDGLLFNFDGKRSFTSTCRAPLQKPGNTFSASFNVTRAGRRLTFIVNGTANPAKPTLALRLTVSATRSCAFGSKTYPVTVIDGNANLALGDAPVLLTAPDDQAVWGFTPGDLVLVGNLAQGVYGQPLCVDGRWYRVTISPDAATISAAPVALGTGRVEVNGPLWSGLFAGKAGVFQVFGHGAVVSLPQDDYQISDLRCWQPEETQAWISPIIRNADRTVTIADGQTAQLPVYAGARATIIADDATNGEITFSLALTDAQGETIETPADLTIPELRFIVLDAAGRRVTEGAFKLQEETVPVYTKEYG